MRWPEVALLLAVATLPAFASAQAGPVSPLVRGEWVATLQAAPRVGGAVGAGGELAVAPPIRLALDGTLGIVTGGPARRTGRVDLLTRYLLDPYAQLRWGLSGGAGLTTQWDDGTPQVGLLLVGGIEGPPRHGWRPGLDVALGRGVRLTVALRRARTRGR